MMNRKRLLNRFIHVTSVVADSPVKQPPEQVTDKSLIQPSDPQSGQQIKDTSAQVVVTLKVPGQRPDIPLTNPVPSLDLGKTLTPRSSDQFEDADHSQYVFGPVSPSVLEKISNLEKQSVDSKFFNMTPLINKRKRSECSLETSDLSKKERKLLKSEEKKKLKSV